MDNCEDESQSLRFPKLDVDIVTGDSFKFAIDLQGKYEDPTSEIEGMVRIGGKRTFYCSRLPISDDEVVGLYENVRFNKHSSGGRAPYFFLFFDGQIRSLFPGKDGNTIFHSKDLALGTPCRLKGKSLRLLDTEAMRVENAQGKYTELAAYLTALNEAAWRLEKTLAKHLIRVHLEFGESSTAKSSRLISVLDFLSSNPDRLVKFLSLKGLQSIRITDKESEQANLSQEALVIPAGITNSPNQLLEWMDRDLWSY
ncbi:MAG: hypothetical protein HY537_14020 [Deltaproteobacteria bacterium]|nr:hypothetical protein [Deltaproteobacteria bacterium]